MLPISKKIWPYTTSDQDKILLVSRQMATDFARRLLELWYGVGSADGIDIGYQNGYDKGISDLLTFFNQSTSVHKLTKPYSFVQ